MPTCVYAPLPEQSADARLKELRAGLARDEKLPAFCIFADKALIALAKARPTTPDQMRAVHGVGAAKLCMSMARRSWNCCGRR